MKMNLQTLSPVGFGIVFILFFACFVGSVVVGVFLAPHVFDSQTSEIFDLQQVRNIFTILVNLLTP